MLKKIPIDITLKTRIIIKKIEGFNLFLSIVQWIGER